ncbi:hypothetical protein [Neorhizobium sp. NCHU2750]|uniref:hypothetical protein n=1 Tax=Neorhizobium sp. NCHU2750 TaxID=1825976 RepID=UPI000EB65170|nr:hypothetical protein NCHU2750_18910 [Neorhizobium sp. NCHU2750]
MRNSPLVIFLIALIIGASIVTFATPRPAPASIAKSDRLAGAKSQIAFLPERFGVASGG